MTGKRKRSAETFEHEYARRSGVSVAALRHMGRVVLPCDCDDAMCDGWVSVSVHNAEDHLRFYADDTPERRKALDALSERLSG